MSKKEIFNQLKFSINQTSKKEKCSKLYLWLSFIYNFIFESFTPKQFISLKIYKYKKVGECLKEIFVKTKGGLKWKCQKDMQKVLN